MAVREIILTAQNSTLTAPFFRLFVFIKGSNEKVNSN